MENLKSMTLQEILAFARLARDPVAFGQELLVKLGAELRAIAAEVVAAREAELKAMKQEAKTLAITFEG